MVRKEFRVTCRTSLCHSICNFTLHISSQDTRIKLSAKAQPFEMVRVEGEYAVRIRTTVGVIIMRRRKGTGIVELCMIVAMFGSSSVLSLNSTAHPRHKTSEPPAHALPISG